MLTRAQPRGLAAKVPSWDFEKKSHGISRALAKSSVFLSHSHRDQDVVAAAGIFLNEFGVSIYVDWKDDTMPTVTSPESASRIKTRTRENNKFILLATNNAVASRWVPWELGVADDAKGRDRIAILPVSDTGQTWQGNEYLGIYPVSGKRPTMIGRFFNQANRREPRSPAGSPRKDEERSASDAERGAQQIA